MLFILQKPVNSFTLMSECADLPKYNITPALILLKYKSRGMHVFEFDTMPIFTGTY
ncbi:MAG: hypothetical protein V4520_02675 [Bacteroidota bacterium]